MKLSFRGLATVILALALIAAAAGVAILRPERRVEGRAQAAALAAERAFLQAQYPTATISGPFEYKEDPVQSLIAVCLRPDLAPAAGLRWSTPPPEYMLEHAYVVATDRVGLTVLVCRDVTSPSGFKAIEKWPKR